MRKRVNAAFVALALSGLTGTAGADPGTATHVDSVSPSAGSASVSVTGGATFVDTPATVAEDSVGDALTPGIGADVSGAQISRAPGSNTLVFRMNIGDMPQGAAAPGVVYGWGISVDGNDSGLYLEASRVGASGCTNGCFRLYRDNGDGTSTTVTTLSGTMGNGAVTWNVGVGTLGASTGSLVGLGGGGLTGTINGADGVGFCCVLLDDFFADDYRVPGPTVQLGIAEAGTPEALVPLTASATVTVGTGAFSGVLPKPAQAGEYIVVAKACYVATACGTASTTLLI
jgi:hypothetical protein